MGIVLTLIILAVILMLVELLMIPGFGIAGVGSIIAFIAAVVYGYTSLDAPANHIILAVTLVLVSVSVFFALKADTWKRFSLDEKIEAKVADNPFRALNKGQEGITVTKLAPGGKVRFGETVYEAKSFDSYIDPRCTVVIDSFDDMSVIVKRKPNENH